MKHIIITGASKGLGKAFYDLLRGDGAYVIGIARSVEKTIDAKSALIPVDLTQSFDPEQSIPWDSLPDASEALLINNAATIEPVGPATNLTEAQMRHAFELNFFAGAKLGSYIAKRYVRARILHIGTGASSRPVEGWSTYCSSKAAIKMFYEVLAQETGILLNTVDPGVMDTQMQETVRKSDFPGQKKYEELKERGALESPADVARRICEENGLL